MKSAVLVVCWWLAVGCAVVLGQEFQFDESRAKKISAAAAAYESKLKYEGKYSSIFGIVPQEYDLEGEDIKKLAIFPGKDPGSLKIKVRFGEARQVLKIPDQIPQIESYPFVLQGKHILLSNNEGEWTAKLAEESSDPVSSEMKLELDRFALRFNPETHPLSGRVYRLHQSQTIDLDKMLQFLGYLELGDVHGNAQAVLLADNDGAPVFGLKIKADFQSGKELRLRTIELEAEGKLTFMDTELSRYEFQLGGIMNIHGTKSLADGRKVPYSLIAKMEYNAAQQPADAGQK